MLFAACQQFLDKDHDEVVNIATETLEGHQMAIMGTMTIEVAGTSARSVHDDNS